MNLNTIFFIGPQGSGKGTQAKILAKRLDFFYWEMGGVLRGMREENTDLGRKVTDMIDNGILVPDDTLIEILKLKLSQIPKEKGVIFDGIPRRLGQAEFIMEFLRNQGRENFATLFIDLPKQQSIDRLLLRAEKENRADDTREKIELRLKQYYDATLPVVDFLRAQTQFFEIDGQPSVEEVTASINKALELE